MSSGSGQIDYDAVRRYFDSAGEQASLAASYMAHAHELPPAAVHYRLKAELATVGDWLEEVPTSGAVLDVGCGAGTWTALFAERYCSVVGIEASASMAKAARRQTIALPNVEIVEGDVRDSLPDRCFDLVFLGGLCMYLNEEDVVTLLRELGDRIGPDGQIVLRESTARRRSSRTLGEYQAVYRTVAAYGELFRQAGFSGVEVRRNDGYTSMEIAVELVETRRRWLTFLPRRSALLGSITWWSLRAVAPLSFWALPRALDRLQIAWPGLQNHFFRLRSPATSSS